MARYLTTVPTPLSAVDAFAWMADITHFAQWDPGVKRVFASSYQGTGNYEFNIFTADWK